MSLYDSKAFCVRCLTDRSPAGGRRRNNMFTCSNCLLTAPSIRAIIQPHQPEPAMTIELAADNDVSESQEAQVAKAYRLAAQAAQAARPEVSTYFEEADRLAAELWGPL